LLNEITFQVFKLLQLCETGSPHYWKSNNNHYYLFGGRLVMFGSPFPMLGNQNCNNTKKRCMREVN